MKGVVMFTRQGKGKVLAVQVVVCLLVVFLPINHLTVPMASGDDSVVDNHIGWRCGKPLILR